MKWSADSLQSIIDFVKSALIWRQWCLWVACGSHPIGMWCESWFLSLSPAYKRNLVRKHYRQIETPSFLIKWPSSIAQIGSRNQMLYTILHSDFFFFLNPLQVSLSSFSVWFITMCRKKHGISAACPSFLLPRMCSFCLGIWALVRILSFKFMPLINKEYFYLFDLQEIYADFSCGITSSTNNLLKWCF